MTDDAIMAPITDAENEAAFRRSLAFNSEAARSGLFAAALDILAEMKKAGVPQAEAALLTGAAEMTAQLWQQVGHHAKVPPRTSRKTLLGEVALFFGKHVRATREGAKAPTMQ